MKFRGTRWHLVPRFPRRFMKVTKNRARYFGVLAFVVGILAVWVILRERFDVQHNSSVTTRQAVSASLAAKDAYGKLPLSFEANRGQADGRVMFLSRGSGYSLFLTATEAIFRMRNAECGMRIEDRGSKIGNRSNSSSIIDHQSSIINPRSSIFNLQSPIRNP